MNPADRYQSVSALKLALKQIDKPIRTDASKSFTWKSLIPPGYRTLTPWKIAVSSISYLCIFWLNLTLETKSTTGLALWLERIFPLCRHRNRILHYVGIVLLDIIIIIYLFVVMVIIESIFFS